MRQVAPPLISERWSRDASWHTRCVQPRFAPQLTDIKHPRLIPPGRFGAKRCQGFLGGRERLGSTTAQVSSIGADAPDMTWWQDDLVRRASPEARGPWRRREQRRADQSRRDSRYELRLAISVDCPGEPFAPAVCRRHVRRDQPTSAVRRGRGRVRAAPRPSGAYADRRDGPLDQPRGHGRAVRRDGRA